MAHDLDRFVTAQDDHGTYDRAVDELRAGRKATHWMWFVFPQIAGLGRSETARHFAIASLGEARDYLAHPVLGARLRECAELLLAHADQPAEAILGPTDAQKLASSMTLFERAAPEEPVFGRVLDAFAGGRRDDRTLDLL